MDRRKSASACAEHGHPGVTFNPWFSQTWCLCGAVTYAGNQTTHAACCDGPLVGR